MPEEGVVYLENWGVTRHPRYSASEPCLRGVPGNDLRFIGGDAAITTSPIRGLQDGRVVTESGGVYQLGKPNPNALSDAFNINREFAYLVLVLYAFSSQLPGATPAVSPQPLEPAPSALVLAFAASPRNGGSSTIQ
jgi:hypothetical protein